MPGRLRPAVAGLQCATGYGVTGYTDSTDRLTREENSENAICSSRADGGLCYLLLRPDRINKMNGVIDKSDLEGKAATGSGERGGSRIEFQQNESGKT